MGKEVGRQRRRREVRIRLVKGRGFEETYCCCCFLVSAFVLSVVLGVPEDNKLEFGRLKRRCERYPWWI